MIISGKQWFTKFDDETKAIMLEKLSNEEAINGTISKIVISKEGKIPSRLYDSHRKAVDRLVKDVPRFDCATASKISRLPQYDTETKELIYCYSSIMALIMLCFPTNRNTDKSMRIKV